MTIDGGRIRKFDAISFEGLPNFVGCQLLAFRGVEQTSGGNSFAQQFAIVGSAGKAGVVEKGLAIEDQPIAIEPRRISGYDLQTDAGEGAALAKLDGLQAIGHERDFVRTS